MKYAIVQDGGKQYRAVEGAVIEVDFLSDAVIGDEMDLPNVLLVVDGDEVVVGSPFVKGAVVQTRVAAQLKGPKIDIFRYRPKKRVRVKTGHRQKYTQLVVDSIQVE